MFAYDISENIMDVNGQVCTDKPPLRSSFLQNTLPRMKQETKLSSLPFTPDLKILRLTKMPDLTSAVRFSSLPSSPLPSRSDSYPDNVIPSYLTLSRKGRQHNSSNGCLPTTLRSFSDSGTDVDEVKEIRSILASLDLAKYKRRGSDRDVLIHTPLRRSVSDQPYLSNNVMTPKTSLLDNIPPPPSSMRQAESESENWKNNQLFSPTGKENELFSFESPVEGTLRSLKSTNSKLKQLTEKLTFSSAPPSPHNKLKLTPPPNSAPATSTTTFWKKPLPPIEQMSFTYDDYEDIQKSRIELNQLKFAESAKDSDIPPKYSTLPKMRSPSSFRRGLKNISNLGSCDVNQSIRQKYDFSILDSLVNRVTKQTFERESSCEISSEKGNVESHLNNKRVLSLPSPPKLNLWVNDGNIKNHSRLEYKEIDDSSNSRLRNETSNNLNNESQLKRFDFAGICTNKRGVDSNNMNSIRKCENSNNNLTHSDDFEDFSKDRFRVKPGTNTSSRFQDDDFSPYDNKLRSFSESKPSLSSKKISKIINPSIINNNYNNEQRPFPEDVEQNIWSRENEMISTSSQEYDLKSSRPRAMSETVTPSKSSPLQMKYFKKPLRGPYGEMLELEMSKSNKTRTYVSDLEFLKELDSIKPVKPQPKLYLRSTSQSFDGKSSLDGAMTPKRKTSANIPIVSTDKALYVPSVVGTVSEPSLISRTIVDDSTKWISDKHKISQVLDKNKDTRTHVVGELYETETSYVESLQIIATKYMKPLKNAEHSEAIDSSQVDVIFYQIPEILNQHEAFLEVLKQRLTNWDTKQKIGDVFIDVFTRQLVIDTYTAFINNWKSAKDAIKSASIARPAFAKFLEQTSREHKGKLSLDALLIMPVQRIPRYELLIKELLKHTPVDHPDHRLLLQAQKEVHDLAVNINRVEREALEQEQMFQKLREIEHVIEGIVDLAQCDRLYVRHDFVCIPGGLGIKKDRCLFLFSDLLLITNIKKKVSAARKASISVNTSPQMSLESNKYKLLMKLPLQNIEIIKKVDERSVKRFLKEVGHLERDVAVLGKISDMLTTLSCQHHVLDDAVKEVLSLVSKQLIDKQTTNSQLMALDLAVTMQNEIENLTIIFPNPEKRMSWEISFGDAKQNLAIIAKKTQPPTFLQSIPIRKTRAGIQVTCATPCELNYLNRVPDIWICNSDGYVGQVCILNLENEPSLTPCIHICNSKILCIINVPGITSSQLDIRRRSTVLSHFTAVKLEPCDTEAEKLFQSFQLDSDTSEDEEFIDSADDDLIDESSMTWQDGSRSTMWLGTEDGCIYVYDCDDVRLKKSKLKMQHSAAVCDLLHVEGKVYAAIANGDIFVYSRDQGSWNSCNPNKMQISNSVAPISKMLFAAGKFWCGSSNNVLLLNSESLEIEHTFQVVADPNRPVLTMVTSNVGMWVAVQNSPIIRLFHFFTFHEILDVNIAPAVTRMLSGCDDIIRQHKSACLRVSALHICKNLLWIGTSAGVLLTMPLPHSSALTSSTELLQSISGMTQGHTGHVRIITSVTTPNTDALKMSDTSVRSKLVTESESTSSIVCAGDGYEDFACIALSESAGRDDSTNHFLIWKV